MPIIHPSKDVFSTFKSNCDKALQETVSAKLGTGKLNNFTAKALGYQNYHALAAEWNSAVEKTESRIDSLKAIKERKGNKYLLANELLSATERLLLCDFIGIENGSETLAKALDSDRYFNDESKDFYFSHPTSYKVTNSEKRRFTLSAIEADETTLTEIRFSNIRYYQREDGIYVEVTGIDVDGNKIDFESSDNKSEWVYLMPYFFYTPEKIEDNFTMLTNAHWLVSEKYGALSDMGRLIVTKDQAHDYHVYNSQLIDLMDHNGVYFDGDISIGLEDIVNAKLIDPDTIIYDIPKLGKTQLFYLEQNFREIDQDEREAIQDACKVLGLN